MDEAEKRNELNNPSSKCKKDINRKVLPFVKKYIWPHMQHDEEH